MQKAVDAEGDKDGESVQCVEVLFIGVVFACPADLQTRALACGTGCNADVFVRDNSV